MDTRYDRLDADRRRKITPDDSAHGVHPKVAVFDELAYYSATVGTKQERERFAVLVRDLVARGRAAGIIVIAATQRPSSDIIPTSLRDLFGYRWAFRCHHRLLLRHRPRRRLGHPRTHRRRHSPRGQGRRPALGRGWGAAAYQVRVPVR